LGTRVDAVDMAGALARIKALIQKRRFAQVVTFGSEMAMLARRDPAYQSLINRADLVVPDTIGVVCAARMLGCRMRERVPGVELVERLGAACASERIPIFLLGGEPGIAQQAAVALVQRHPGLIVAGTQHGYFAEADSDAVAKRIRDSGARLALVALGFPKQEFWVSHHAAALGELVCIGVGGTFDVISGKLVRAPRLVRSLGLEWLYRLAREPRRLRRQLVLPEFALRVAGQALRERSNRTASAQDNAGAASNGSRQ
jgi:N-acetylglucosaminyldiphosphoundecaprenol N-acetyl-beta-D-mannosaminyltransferase